MIAQIKAEFLKVRSTRTTIGLLIGMIALILLFTLLTGLLASVYSFQTREQQREFFSLGLLAGLFASLSGVLLITSEYRYGTIRPTILFNPKRSQIIVAKVIAGALSGIVFAVVGEALGWALGLVILHGRGIPIVLTRGDAELLVLAGLASVALSGAIGVGLGAIVRNQVAGVITFLAWAFIVSPLLVGLVPSVGRFMPGEAEDALVGLHEAHLLMPVPGGIVLVGWVLLLGALGLAVTAKSDVS
jgi:ABC-type transport system involved in multi-copper enzyme maturation permease subunit